METSNQEAGWLKRGRQRSAVAQAIYKPMTEMQILEKARLLAPRIQLRDVWFQLRQLGEKELTYCLTPQPVTGKLYFLTETGRTAVAEGYGKAVQPLPEDIDWNRYALIMRAKVRHLILEELARPCRQGMQEKTATEIRKRLLDAYPLCLNSVLRALKELTRLRLARLKTSEKSETRKLYVLTPMGRRLVREMQR